MTETQRAAMQQALEALEKCKAALAEELAAWDIDPPLRHVLEASNSCGPSIAALRAALAEPEPEPVAWLTKWANAYDGEAYTQWQKGYDAARSVVKAHLPALAEPEPPIWQTLAEIGASAPAGTWDAPVATPPALQLLTDEEIVDAMRAFGRHAGWSLDDDALNRYVTLIRAVERAHGI